MVAAARADAVQHHIDPSAAVNAPRARVALGALSLVVLHAVVGAAAGAAALRPPSTHEVLGAARFVLVDKQHGTQLAGMLARDAERTLTARGRAALSDARALAASPEAPLGEADESRWIGFGLELDSAKCAIAGDILGVAFLMFTITSEQIVYYIW